MEILCSLDNIQFSITKYEIKNKEIKLEILFDTNKYKGLFEQLEIKCIPLLFDKYKDTILQLKIYSDIYQVKCKDCEFFRPNIHTDLEKYRKHLFNIYSKIMNDPSWIVAQHMKGFENLHLDDADKKKEKKDKMTELLENGELKKVEKSLDVYFILLARAVNEERGMNE